MLVLYTPMMCKSNTVQLCLMIVIQPLLMVLVTQGRLWIMCHQHYLGTIFFTGSKNLLLFVFYIQILTLKHFLQFQWNMIFLVIGGINQGLICGHYMLVISICLCLCFILLINLQFHPFDPYLQFEVYSYILKKFNRFYSGAVVGARGIKLWFPSSVNIPKLLG